MSPNNHSVTATASTAEEPEDYKMHTRSEEGVLNRKNKNILNSDDLQKDINGNVIESKDSPEYKIEPAWFNIFGFVYLHYCLIQSRSIVELNKTLAFALIIGLFTGFGITAGAHRLWAHGAYKANKKLKIILVIFETIAFQNSVIEWVRDHRVHHKFTDTNADPHNASRGFFFSHMGWLMCKKHPDVKKYGAKVDMSDLESDPILAFQHKYYAILMPLASFVLPIFLSTYFFGDSLAAVYHWNLFRYVLTLHITWSINSVSHIWGSKPFEKDIAPTDTYIIGFLAFGEGWHNYHHVYPWDYKVSELPRYWCNFSIPFLDFFAWLGWATDLKTVSDEMIRKRVLRTGDGSHRYSKKSSDAKTAKELLDTFNNNNNNSNNGEGEHVDTLWGWGDDDMDADEKKDVKILHPTFVD